MTTVNHQERIVLRPETVQKIAVLRANALGDFIFVLPALAALKRHFVNAELVYLGKTWHRRFLSGRPGPVDRVLDVPRYNGIPHETDRVTEPAVVEEFFARMQAEAFDIAFQMHGGGGNSNPFIARLGADLTVGFQTPGAPSLDINVPYQRWQSETVRYLDLVRHVGAWTPDIAPHLPVTCNDLHALRAVLPDMSTPFVVLHPGATDRRRRWAPAHFAQVGDELAAHGYQVVITGADDEQILVEGIVNRMRRSALDLAGRLELDALTALLSRAALVVSNDTGPLHLARAVGAPTVGIYWVGNVITGGPVSMQGNRICISWETHCPRCGKDCVNDDVREARDICDHACSLVDSVSPDDVLSNAQELLRDIPPQLVHIGRQV